MSIIDIMFKAVMNRAPRARGFTRKFYFAHPFLDAFSVHAMKLDDSGDALWLLQQHLGHASFDTTAKYRKIAGNEQREWYDRLWNESA